MYTGLVSRQAVIEHLSKRLYETALNNVDKSEVYTDIAENRLTVWVDELPSIQPKEKTGKWIKDEDGKVTCNNCYEYSIVTDNIVGATDLLEVITLTMKYCPNCGAKWRLKKMPKHNLEELDKGQLDFMWNFLRFKCGQKSNIPLLKHNLDMLRQAMIQKTGGQAQYKKADDVSFEDFGTIINCIVIETMQLYLSGDLDKLEELKNG